MWVTKVLAFGDTYGGRPYGVLTVVETAVDHVANTSTVSITLVLKRPRAVRDEGTKTASCTVAGQTRAWVGTLDGVGDKTLISAIQTVPHNSDGSRSILLMANIGLNLQWNYDWLGTISSTGFMALTNLPRSGSVSQSLNSKTETTITMNWTSDNEIDTLWYSVDGVTWHGVNNADDTNGSYTITGLTANSNYSVQTRVRLKSSGITSDSVPLNVATYSYPFCNSAPDVTIGDKLTLGFYNPLNRNITVNILGADGSQISDDQTNGTTITGYNGPLVKDSFYASIPNAKSGTYKVKVTYGNHINTVNGGRYSVNVSESAPKLGTISYLDTNQVTTAITGDPQKIIRSKSLVAFNASGIYPTNHATIINCKVEINGVPHQMALTGSNAQVSQVTINSSADISALVKVTDSRGLVRTKAINISMVDWVRPSANIVLERVANYYSETTLKVSAYISPLGGQNTCTIQTRNKKTTDTSYSNFTVLQNDVPVTLTLDNSQEWDVQVQITDVFETATYNLKLPRGTPLIFIDKIKNSVGINCFPTMSESLEINGNNIIPSARTLYLGSNTTNLTVNSYTAIPLNLSKTAGGRLSAANYGIVIGDGITKVLVSGAAFFSTVSASGRKSIKIVKNSYSASNALGWAWGYLTASEPGGLMITPVVADVRSGDAIYLMYYTGDSGDVIGGDTEGSQTHLTVQTL